MTTNPITGTSATAGTQTPAQTSQKSSPTSVADSLTKTDTFLMLLVAQLKNQNPLNPADGTAFVTQLATFSGVEQSTRMRDDLDAIRTALEAAANSAATAAAATATGSISSPSSTTTNTTSDSSTAKS